MAIAAPSHAFLEAFLPVARASLNPTASQRIPLLHRLRSSVLPAVFLPIPAIVDTLWDGLLKAVPKKKTSHSKKRSRFLAGKALKDVTALNKCSSCGRAKRAHVLCPYCVASIRAWFMDKLGAGEQIRQEEDALGGQLKPELRLRNKTRHSADSKPRHSSIPASLGEANNDSPLASQAASLQQLVKDQAAIEARDAEQEKEAARRP